MTKEQQQNLIKFGEEIGLLISPTEIDGQLAVAYGKFVATDPFRAHTDLLILSSNMCAV